MSLLFLVAVLLKQLWRFSIALTACFGLAQRALQAYDRAMICGSLGFTNDFRRLLTDRGLGEGLNARPGGFVYEKAFVG